MNQPYTSTHQESALCLDYEAMCMLVDQFDWRSVIGLRDAAVMSLMLCAGLRDTEVIALDMADLRECYGGKLALRVPAGRGMRPRPIFYYDLEPVLKIVEAWIQAAELVDGPVFRGFYRRGLRIKEALTPRGLQSIFNNYPTAVNDQLRRVTPLDLRRTYARYLLETGMDMKSLQVQLGVSDGERVLQLIQGYEVPERVDLPAVLAYANCRL